MKEKSPFYSDRVGYFFYQVTELKEEVLSNLVTLFTSLGFLVEGAPKGSYDVELVLAYYKSMSVFKRYYLPLQNKLPQEPAVSTNVPYLLSLLISTISL